MGKELHRYYGWGTFRVGTEIRMFPVRPSVFTLSPDHPLTFPRLFLVGDDLRTPDNGSLYSGSQRSRRLKSFFQSLVIKIHFKLKIRNRLLNLIIFRDTHGLLRKSDNSNQGV